jgi:hypothetical protein
LDPHFSTALYPLTQSFDTIEKVILASLKSRHRERHGMIEKAIRSEMYYPSEKAEGAYKVVIDPTIDIKKVESCDNSMELEIGTAK